MLDIRYSEMEHNESYKHKAAKNVVFNWLKEGKFKFLDQNGCEFVCHDRDDFSNHRLIYSIESPITNQLENHMPYPMRTCVEKCVPDEYKYIDHRLSGGRLFSTITYDEILYKTIGDTLKKSLFETTESGAECFGDHVCNNCSFNKFDYKFIFDIGIADKRNDRYIAAIELTNTNPPSEEKIKYCEQHKIKLFEVNVEDVLKQTNKPEYLFSRKLA